MANSFTFVTILLQHRPSIHVAIKLLNNSLLCYVYTYVTFVLSFHCNYVPCCSPSAIVLYSASLVLGIFLIILKIQLIYASIVKQLQKPHADVSLMPTILC